MKSLIWKISFFLVFWFLAFPVEAQFINKIKNAAARGVQNAVADKAEEEAYKAMQRQLEKQLAGLYGENAEGSPVKLDMEKIMAGLGENVPTESQYEFAGFGVMEMNSVDEKGKTQDPVKLKAYMAKGTGYTAMEFSDPKEPSSITTMIFDMTNQATILLMDNEGTKNSLAYKLDFDSIQETATEKDTISLEPKDFTIEKTGKTNTILGYSCEEYFIKTEDGEGFYWVTKEPIGGYPSFWSQNSPFTSSQTQEKYSKQFKNAPEGNFMEMYWTSIDGSKIDMKVIEIEATKAKTFQMSDYPNIMQASAEK
jgi:hypothetical protein